MKRAATTALRAAFEFMNWWVQELTAAADDLRSHLSPRWRRSLTVYVSRSRLQVLEGDARTDAPILDLVRTAQGSEAAPSASKDQALLAGGRRVRLVLDPEFAFVQRLRMPLAVLPHLASAIELQMPKLFPVNAALLRSDFEIVAIDSPRASVEVDLASIKRSDIEPVESSIEQWGLQIASVHLGCVSEPRVRFTFGRSDTRVNRLAITRADTRLAASAAALAVCAVAVFSVQAVRAHRYLDRALAQTSTEAAAVLQQRQALISRLDTLSLVSQLERTTTAAAVLGDVTTHLDRDSWLTTFELKGRDLHLVGLSSEPATTVKQLATSPLLTDVELRSSTSAGSNSGKDRFEITAQVKAGS
jgi:hypothetical protein